MSEKEERKERKPERAEPERRLPRWKKVLLAVAAAMVIVGFGLGLAGGQSKPDPAGGRPNSATTPNSLVVRGQGGTGGTTSTAAAEVEGEGSTWSPFLVKGGFSFVLAFCVGYALRTFLKLSMLVVGVLAAGLFLLGYGGVVDVDWSTVEGWYDSVVAKVREESSGFRSFVAGSLPSAGMAALGLVTGFKKS